MVKSLFKWSKLRIIIASVAIISVIIIPAYAALNEQSKVEEKTPKPAAYVRVEEPAVIFEPEQTPDIVAPQTTASAAPKAFPTPTPVAQPTLPSGIDVIDETEPVKEKWIPEFPVTDQALLRDNLVEEGTLNILILGRDRNYILDDAFGIANIDTNKKTIKLIMIPRDTYITYTDEVINATKQIKMDKQAGWWKINNAYKVGTTTEKIMDHKYFNNKFKDNGYNFVCQVVYEKFDIEIDEYFMISTLGFSKLVDIFGYVTVYVPVNMRYYDPTQNLSINIPKGTQRLDGKQAEGFVRFRQSLNSQGQLLFTYDRTKSQIAFMKAFFEQHGKLSNVTKIPEILTTLNRYVETSLNMGDILTTYTQILNDIVKEDYELTSHEIEYKGKYIGGSVYSIIEYKSGLDEQTDQDANDG